MSHSHRCDYPRCKVWVECSGRPVIDSIEDGIKHGHYDCEDFGPKTHLCDDHEGERPCGNCGEYGHADTKCKEQV